MGKIYGYARCSTNEDRQDITRQIRELKNMGVDPKNIFKEYESGAKVNRVELQRLLDIVADGDTIVATEPSRITRSTKQLCDIIEFAKNKHLKIILGTFILDCTKELDPMTEGMLMIMGVFSQLERSITSQRIKSGLANRRANGKPIGRQAVTIDKIPQKVLDTYKLYKDGAITKKDYAKLCDITRPTLDKYLKIIIGE